MNENQIKLIERFPHSDVAFVETALEVLRSHDLIETTSYSCGSYEAYQATVATSFDHAGRLTYIFPEEARLLYALAEIAQPTRVAFMGAYYGYWAVWALPAIAKSGGKAILLDIDEECVALARRNIERLGFAGTAQALSYDAISYLRQTHEQFDWIVLDAEGPKCGLPYDQTDKAVYYPMARAALERLRPDGLFICHNILTTHHNHDPYFANVIRNNRRQFYRFLPFIQTVCSRCAELSSTEGIGVYRR